MNNSSEVITPAPSFMKESYALQFASVVFRTGVKLRNHAYDKIPRLSEKTGRKVISIGGIRAGGTGKTPAALLTGKYLISKGYDVCFLSRGYGRRKHRQVIIKPYEKPDWKEVGDEPALLHKNLPQCWLGIGSKRIKSAEALCGITPEKTVFVLDDGFQHRALSRDLDIVCLHHNFFSDHIMPRGFLREPVSSLGRAQLFLLIASSGSSYEDLCKTRDLLNSRFKQAKTSILIQKADCWINGSTGENQKEPPLKNPSLLCAIARPQRFIEMVRSLGIEPLRTICFKDHYVFHNNYFFKKRELYSSGIVTTEKDFIRLRSLKNLPETWYLKIRMDFADKKSNDAFYSTIDSILY